MKCNACGADILPGDKFCSNCGVKINLSIREEIPEEKVKATPEKHIPAEPVNTNNAVSNNAETKKETSNINKTQKSSPQIKPPKKSPKLIATIAIILLVLASVLFFVVAKAVNNSLKVFTPYASTECAGKTYDQVKKDFSLAGFTKIEIKALADLEYGDVSDEGNVQQVSINGISDFDGNHEFKKTDRIVITYHSPKMVTVPLSSSAAKDVVGWQLKNVFSNAGFREIVESEVIDLDPDKTSAEFESEVKINSLNTFKDYSQFPVNSKIEIVTHKPYEKYTLDLVIDFVGNWFFDKYDVRLTLGEYSNSLEHGKDAEFKYRLKPGQYTITFTGIGSSSSKGSVDIDIFDDTEAAYQIWCYSDHIDVKKQYIEYKHAAGENEAMIPASPTSCKGSNYETVQQQFAKAGFSNISYKILYDIVWGVTPNGSVEKVTVDGKSDFARGEVFPKDAPIIITYHMPSEDDPNKPTPTPAAAPTSRPTSTPSSNNKSSTEEEILTKANCDDLAAILSGDYLDAEAQQRFVQKYRGRTIEFNCLVGMLMPSPKYKTICTYVLVPGTQSNSIDGAAMFLVEDASPATFHWDRDTRPSYLEQWSKIRIRAKVKSWTDSMYIEIEPIKTWGKQFDDPIQTSTPMATSTPKPTPKPTTAPQPSSSMPTMSGTSLDKVMQVAKNYGLSRAFSDENFGHGTKNCSLQSQSGGLTLDVIYSSSTREVLSGQVVTFNTLSTNEEQSNFIQAISAVLCPENSVDAVTGWVKNNVGDSQKTTIDSFTYEVSLGPTGNLLYYAGYDNWEDWELSFD